jgi:hypothetical protein
MDDYLQLLFATSSLASSPKVWTAPPMRVIDERGFMPTVRGTLWALEMRRWRRSAGLASLLSSDCDRQNDDGAAGNELLAIFKAHKC